MTQEEIDEFCGRLKMPPLPESLNGLPGEYREAVKTIMTHYGKTCALRMYQNMQRAAQRQWTDDELTSIYKRSNGEDTGKAQPLTTQRIFKAMRTIVAQAMKPSMESKE